MQFTVAGRPIDLDHQAVIDRLKGKEPPQHGRQKLFITVNRKHWPVKAALSQASGVDVSAFPTSEAVRVLSRLGFQVNRVEAK